MRNLFFRQRAQSWQALSALLLMLACSDFVQVKADEVFSRPGLDPSQQSKVTGVLARERIQRNPSPAALPAGAPNRAPAAVQKECRTDIGNFNAANMRPGQKTPKDNIVVIKAPVINNCR